MSAGSGETGERVVKRRTPERQKGKEEEGARKKTGGGSREKAGEVETRKKEE